MWIFKQNFISIKITERFLNLVNIQVGDKNEKDPLERNFNVIFHESKNQILNIPELAFSTNTNYQQSRDVTTLRALFACKE